MGELVRSMTGLPLTVGLKSSKWRGQCWGGRGQALQFWSMALLQALQRCTRQKLPQPAGLHGVLSSLSETGS